MKKIMYVEGLAICRIPELQGRQAGGFVFVLRVRVHHRRRVDVALPVVQHGESENRRRLGTGSERDGTAHSAPSQEGPPH